jgi:hypothetical protein
MTKRFSNVAGVVLSVFIVCAFVSCDNFYSTSWGKEREYDASKIKLTESNLKMWKEKAAGNPKLAEALVKKIISELPGKSGAEKAAFQEAGIELAIEQAGIGTKIIELAGSALSEIDNEAGLQDLLSKVQGGVGSAVHKAAANIAQIVGASTNHEPTFPNGGSASYQANANPANVGLAVLVLSLSLIPDIGSKELSDLSENLTLTGGSVTATGSASNEEKALAAYLNLIADNDTGKYDNNVITSGIQDAFLEA